jgi:hypothetical protein
MPFYDVELRAKISLNAKNTVRIEAADPEEAFYKAEREAAYGKHRAWKPLYEDFVERGAYSIQHLQFQRDPVVKEALES